MVIYFIRKKLNTVPEQKDEEKAFLKNKKVRFLIKANNTQFTYYRLRDWLI